MAVQVKLTLRVDKQLIQRAKLQAKKAGKSLSRIVAEYFILLGENSSLVIKNKKLPPVTQSLKGVLKGHGLDKKDYHQYLESKYL